MFTSAEQEDTDQELVQETKDKIVCISSLNYLTKEIINHVVKDEIGRLFEKL